MSTGKTVTFLILGAVFWFVAAMYVQFLGPHLFDLGTLHIAAFLVSLASGPVFLWIASKVAGHPLGDMVAPAALMILSATFLDAIAITYVPALYGGTGPLLALGAAQILWGVFAALLAAFLLQTREA